ncbi:MAG: hypothetical protein WEC54_02565, partial [Gemmatimonadales bacterium]
RLASELCGWKIDLYSSREWLERGGEGPLFAPLPSDEEATTDVNLRDFKGLPAELVGTLESAGLVKLSELLDLADDDVASIPGLSDEHRQVLVSFLAELTEDESAAAPQADATEQPPVA